MRATTAALIGAFVLSACAATRSGDPDRHAAAAAPGAAGASAAGSGAAAGDPGVARRSLEAGRPVDRRKVIRTGQVELVVTAYDAARARLDAMIAAAGGYIDSTEVQRHPSGSIEAVLAIRLPADAFEGLIPTLQELGEVTGETTHAADITDQFVDTSARLAGAARLEKRLLELATDRGGNLDQVLAVERELARVRDEIEGYQGHLDQWSDQVAMSTLTLSISTRRAAVARAVAASPPTLGAQTSHAFRASTEALRALGAWALVHGVALLPWLLILVPGGALLRRLARRYRRDLPVATAIAPPPAAS